MRAIAIFVAVLLALGASAVQADPVIASVQQTLKDQGFYYGEITGTKDADTAAAIRRYQIRNGLQISGDLSAETRKALGLKGAGPAAAATPAPRSGPSPRAPEPSLQDDAGLNSQPPPPNYSRAYPSQNPGSLFQGTPYENAPPETQRRVVLGAQTLLARRGYYRNEIDGVYGPGTGFAVRAYQSRFGMEPSGHLDMETLAALGLLPGQQAPGVTAPVRRAYPRPRFIVPRGEPIYTPR